MAREGYVALSDAYRTGEFTTAVERFCDPEIVVTPAGLFPETNPMHGYGGLIQFATLQAEAFDGFWVEPLEFIDAGDRVVVPVRFGGRARHTGIDVAFEVVHVLTLGNERWTRIDMYLTKPQALKAVGLE